MLLINDLIGRSVDIMTLQVLNKIDDQIRAQTDYRIKGNMGFVVQDAKELKETLTACRPTVIEFRDRCVQLAEEKR
jgi:hypothetical protein